MEQGLVLFLIFLFVASFLHFFLSCTRAARRGRPPSTGRRVWRAPPAFLPGASFAPLPPLPRPRLPRRPRRHIGRQPRGGKRLSDGALLQRDVAAQGEFKNSKL